MKTLLSIALLGALGALCRHAVGVYMQRRWPTGWMLGLLPAGTLLVNVLGSFALGTLAGMALVGERVPEAWRPAIATGFLGSFTTFSTFSVETLRLFERGAWGMGLLNIGLQLGLGLGAAGLGLMLGRAIG